MVGPIYIEGGGPDKVPVEKRKSYGVEFLEKFKDNPLIIPCVMPHATYTVSPQFLQEAQELADDYDAYLHTHASETETEVKNVVERFGKTPVHHLDDLGMLNARTILAHCVHVTPDEIALMAERGTSIVHNPLSNLKLGSGIAPVSEMLAAGAKVALGTDGPVSSNDLDMWTAMRFAILLPRGVHRDASLLKSTDIVKMVTIEGAKALGIDDKVGSVEVGKRADIILVDLNRPHLAPMFDVYAHLAYTVGRDDVSTVVINGKVVMRDRVLTTIDEESAMAEVNALAEQISAAVPSA
jgi:5-methylthioadenosine/S-adenosylhomocysteine deaminase